MRNLFIIISILACSTSFSQTPKYGWIPTGRVQRWPALLIWNTDGDTDSALVQVYERYYNPAPDDPTRGIKRATDWKRTGKYFDVRGHKVDTVYSVIYLNPKTKISYQQ